MLCHSSIHFLVNNTPTLHTLLIPEKLERAVACFAIFPARPPTGTEVALPCRNNGWRLETVLKMVFGVINCQDVG
jgi:hypothetical protein